MSDLTSPHDRFFRDILSQPDAARSFVEHYVPAEVVSALDLASLEVTRDSFVDADLRSHLADLVCRAELRDGGPAYLYLLFEHKSSPTVGVAFQLLRYVVRLWSHALRQGEAFPLPPIIPVVFYHGRAPWRVSTNFADLVRVPPGLEVFAPRFRYHLCDLSTFTDDELRGEAVLRAALLTFKHIFDPDLAERLPGVLGLLADVLGHPTALGSLETLLRYVTSASTAVKPEDLGRAIEEAFHHKGDDLMPTAAEIWIEQGKKQGHQQGLQQGQAETARGAVLEALEARFELVPRTIRERLDGIDDPALLKTLHRKAVTTPSLDTFRAALDVVLS